MTGHSSPRASAAECVEYLDDYAKKHGFSSNILLGQEVLEVVARPVAPPLRGALTAGVVLERMAGR